MSRTSWIVVVAVQVVMALAMALLWLQLTDRGSTDLGAAQPPVASRALRPELLNRCERIGSPNAYCALDFVLLSILADELSGKRVELTGFLAVDRGNVTLYADEESYRLQQRSRSVELRARETELLDIFDAYAYKHTRVAGVFYPEQGQPQRGPLRLGVLLPPLSVIPAQPVNKREGRHEIVLHPDFVEQSSGQ